MCVCVCVCVMCVSGRGGGGGGGRCNGEITMEIQSQVGKKSTHKNESV